MSSVKRIGRKVFRSTVGGLVASTRKLRKPALIIGATFLTAGLVSGGFAMGSAGGIGGFFQGVGQTLSQGGQAISGALGFGGAATGGASTVSLAGGSGATSMLSQQAGILQSMGVPSSIASATTGAATAARATGFLGTVGNALRSMGSSTVGQLAIAQGIMGGIQSFAQARETRRQERRHDEGVVWGAQRRGGEGEDFMPDIDVPTFAPPRGAPPTIDQFRAGQPQYAQASPENMAFRRPLIQQPTNVPGMLDFEDEDLFMPMTANQGIMYG